MTRDMHSEPIGPSRTNDPGESSTNGAGSETRSRDEKRARQNEEKMLELIANALRSRSEFMSQFTDPRRDLNKECGYLETAEIDPRKYQELYDRNGIAARVVQVLAKETWQVQPQVYEEEDPEVVTPFEEDWDVVSKTLRSATAGHDSYYAAGHGSQVWTYLKRMDVMSGIGRYGVLLLGLEMYEGEKLSDPAIPKAGRKLLYLRTLPESLAPITKYENDPANPRFGQPVEYSITLNDPRAYEGGVQGYWANEVVKVHHSRVIHYVPETVLASEVFGIPRMQQPLNRLMDLDKLYGGSAEMYWRGAFPGMSFESLPELGAEPDVDVVGMRSMVEKYMNGLQRYLALIGFSAKSLAPQVVDPTPQILVQIQAICILLGIPMRIFMGSERGELASSMDDAAWNDRLRDRQKDHVTPMIICPFVDRLIYLGVLREPSNKPTGGKLASPLKALKERKSREGKDSKDTKYDKDGKGEGYQTEPRPERVRGKYVSVVGYKVWWPDLTSQTGQEKAQIAFQRTQALVQYVKGEGWRVIPPLDFLTRMLGFEEREAVSIINNAIEEGYFELEKTKTSGNKEDFQNLGKDTEGKADGDPVPNAPPAIGRAVPPQG